MISLLLAATAAVQSAAPAQPMSDCPHHRTASQGQQGAAQPGTMQHQQHKAQQQAAAETPAECCKDGTMDCCKDGKGPCCAKAGTASATPNGGGHGGHDH